VERTDTVTTHGEDCRPSRTARAAILGVEVDRLTMEETISRIVDGIDHRIPCHHVVVNAAKIVAMTKDPVLESIVRNCQLVNADGQSVVWASRLLGDPLPERVAGIDLMQQLLQVAEERGYRPYFLGAREEVVNEFVERVKKNHPGLQLAGWRNGYFGNAADEMRVVKDIADSHAEILFVAMGTPMKEFWIHRHFTAINVPFCMGVGGSFDVYSGHVKRAPVWAQRAGLEWLFRLLQEPRRLWWRYLSTNIRFGLLTLRWLAGLGRRT